MFFSLLLIDYRTRVNFKKLRYDVVTRVTTLIRGGLIKFQEAWIIAVKTVVKAKGFCIGIWRLSFFFFHLIAEASQRGKNGVIKQEIKAEAKGRVCEKISFQRHWFYKTNKCRNPQFCETTYRFRNPETQIIKTGKT